MSVEKFGRFLESENCFEITSEPPRKWRNILYNQWGENEYYSEATHIGDGMSRFRDAEGNTLNVIGYDAKYLYIRDDETNLVFNPAGMPVATEVKNRRIRIFPSKTEIMSECADLRVTARYFVPRTETVEIWSLFIENLSDKERKISVFAYASFILSGNDREGRPFGTEKYSEFLPEQKGIMILNRIVNVPMQKKNGFLCAVNHFKASNGERDNFTRADYGLGAPKILWGWNADNRAGYSWNPAAIVQCSFSIPPKSRERTDFILGPCADKKEISEILSRLSVSEIDRLEKDAFETEKKRISAFEIKTGAENSNRDALINIFVKKQIYSYLIDKGGVRDNLQNDNALSLFDPATARANILKCLSVQKPDGSCLHSWKPLNRKQYSDKPAWFLQTVPWYIKETGDFSILDEKVYFFESNENATVLEHLKRAFRFLANDTGKRGLCLQHYADWNDALEPSAKTGERESVMVSQQLCAGLIEMEELASRIGNSSLASECKTLHSQMAEKINKIAWDGKWYQRTICEDGYPLGSNKNEEAKIFINTQSWAVIGKIADRERLLQCMESVDKYLEKPEGFAICDPPCTKFDERIGRFTTVMPFNTENGGCYNHAAGFKTVADCILGRAEKAWQTYIKVCPDSPELPIEVSEAEPFSFINHYSRVPSFRGRGGYPWRTGTAAWFTVALIEWILGARRHYDGLFISPCLSAKVPYARLLRTFRNAKYDIEIDNSEGKCVGAREIIINGKTISGNVIPSFPSGIHKVKVIV